MIVVTMKILAADTSTAINTVAVCDGGNILAETVVHRPRSHAERLLATVEWVLDEASLELGGLDALAVSIGPGSFTGLRIGAATWKGLAFAGSLPLVAVPTLDAMTRLAAFRDALVCPLLDARMGEVFGAVYRFRAGVRTKLTEDRVCAVEEIVRASSAVNGDVERIFFGDGALFYKERILAEMEGAVILEGPCALPRASTVAVEAAALLAHGARADAEAVSPLYLRKAQAETMRANRERRPNE